MTPNRLFLGWLTVEKRRLLLLSSLAFAVISSHQSAYLYNLFTLRTQTILQRVSPRFISPLLYSVQKNETLNQSFHITAMKCINSFAEYRIPLDLLCLDRSKFLVRSQLTTHEIEAQRLRVDQDRNLVLNPLSTIICVNCLKSSHGTRMQTASALLYFLAACSCFLGLFWAIFTCYISLYYYVFLCCYIALFICFHIWTLHIL